MNRIKELDIIFIALSRLTKSQGSCTINDLEEQVEFSKNKIEVCLNYLIKEGICEANSNKYQINFEGEIFIDKTLFLFKNRPFYYQNKTKQLKVNALFINALALLLISILTFMNQVNKSEKAKIKTEKKEKTIKMKSIKADSIKKIFKEKDTVK